jgi:hypothetical protein
LIAADLTERIRIVHHTRGIAAASLADALGRSYERPSERAICDAWLETIGKTPSICAQGWYQPPPGGAAVLIGHPEDSFSRLNYDSLRTPAFWASNDIVLRDDSLIYVYASPFDRATGLIGDLGLTVYRGNKQPIRDYLSMCLEMTIRIASFAEVGMEFRELFHYAQRQIEAAQLRNETSSTASGLANIGHTVPWSYEEYSDDAAQCLAAGDMRAIGDMISRHRVSINASATLRIQPTMAFTVEPQIASSTAPLCSYHSIVSFSDGRRTISLPFNALFNAFAMTDYIPTALLSQLS